MPRLIDWRYYQPIFKYEKYFQDYDWPWAGHKYFVYDLIRNTKPRVIVELGTERGTSFFSMAQAVKDEHLNSQLFAVDTWIGDKHTGPYNETYYQDVQYMQRAFYRTLVITLLRTTFDEAVKQFKPRSIDLLHIDGLHTYQAVAHDFETWINRLKPNGIVVLHDINERKDDFGVYRLWAKLKKKYRTVEFLHAHGLGVVFLGKQSPKFSYNPKLWQLYYEGVYDLKVFEQVNSQLATELSQLKENLNPLINELNTIKSSKMYRTWRKYHALKDRLKARRG